MYLVKLNDLIDVMVPTLDIKHLELLMAESEKIRPIQNKTKQLLRNQFNESIKNGNFRMVEQ